MFKTKILPLSLTLVVIAFDQYVKFLIITHIPLYSVGLSIGGDFLRIIHMENTGIAFSMGDSLPDNMRMVLFVAIPLVVVALVLVTYFKNNDFSALQRWAIAGVVGGGFGNLIDRFFRHKVVDFIDVKFYGLFGLERWPTFNVADMAVLICAFIFMISIMSPGQRIKIVEEL